MRGQRREIGVDRRQRRLVRGIDDVEHAIGLGDFVVRASDALGLDLVRRVAQPRRVQDVQRQPVDLDALAQHVARRARNGGHDRGLVAGEAIEQAGLAGVRPARDHEREPIAQQRALPRALGEFGESTADGLHALAERAVGQEVDFLLGKVDRGLDPHAQLEHSLDELVHLRRELAA